MKHHWFMIGRNSYTCLVFMRATGFHSTNTKYVGVKVGTSWSQLYLKSRAHLKVVYALIQAQRLACGLRAFPIGGSSLEHKPPWDRLNSYNGHITTCSLMTQPVCVRSPLVLEHLEHLRRSPAIRPVHTWCHNMLLLSPQPLWLLYPCHPQERLHTWLCVQMDCQPKTK